MTMPGAGTESADFGLACYPKTYRDPKEPTIWSKRTIHFDGTVEPDSSAIVAPEAEIIVDAPLGYSWSGWCKTQYANRYGRDHFMRCHLALIKLLDYAREIRILDRVNDDGGYWETRSADVLLANLRKNDALVAAVVGNLHDAFGGAIEEAGYVWVSPIASAPDFEHLEAEGREQLATIPPALASGVLSGLRAASATEAAPIISWPAIDLQGRWPSLRESIEGMQRLNPSLDLRVVPDQHGLSYLGHDGSSLDLIHLKMPYRVSDDLATALTEYNVQRLRIKLEDGEFEYTDARRIERTSSGSLLIRPRSWAVTLAYNGIGKELKSCLDVDFSEKVYPGWCVLPAADGEEVWEFDWSYWPKTHDVACKRPDGTYRKNREYWAQLAGGLIAIRDQYDLSRAEIEARCRKAVEMGVEWCVLIDQEAHDLSVLRADGLEHVRSVNDWTLRELPDMKWKRLWLSPPIAYGNDGS